MIIQLEVLSSLVITEQGDFRSLHRKEILEDLLLAETAANSCCHSRFHLKEELWAEIDNTIIEAGKIYVGFNEEWIHEPSELDGINYCIFHEDFWSVSMWCINCNNYHNYSTNIKSHRVAPPTHIMINLLPPIN